MKPLQPEASPVRIPISFATVTAPRGTNTPPTAIPQYTVPLINPPLLGAAGGRGTPRPLPDEELQPSSSSCCRQRAARRRPGPADPGLGSTTGLIGGEKQEVSGKAQVRGTSEAMGCARNLGRNEKGPRREVDRRWVGLPCRGQSPWGKARHRGVRRGHRPPPQP